MLSSASQPGHPKVLVYFQGRRSRSCCRPERRGAGAAVALHRPVGEPRPHPTHICLSDITATRTRPGWRREVIPAPLLSEPQVLAEAYRPLTQLVVLCHAYRKWNSPNRNSTSPRGKRAALSAPCAITPTHPCVMGRTPNDPSIAPKELRSTPWSWERMSARRSSRSSEMTTLLMVVTATPTLSSDSVHAGL